MAGPGKHYQDVVIRHVTKAESARESVDIPRRAQREWNEQEVFDAVVRAFAWQGRPASCAALRCKDGTRGPLGLLLTDPELEAIQDPSVCVLSLEVSGELPQRLKAAVFLLADIQVIHDGHVQAAAGKASLAALLKDMGDYAVRHGLKCDEVDDAIRDASRQLAQARRAP